MCHCQNKMDLFVCQDRSVTERRFLKGVRVSQQVLTIGMDGWVS